MRGKKSRDGEIRNVRVEGGVEMLTWGRGLMGRAKKVRIFFKRSIKTLCSLLSIV